MPDGRPTTSRPSSPCPSSASSKSASPTRRLRSVLSRTPFAPWAWSPYDKQRHWDYVTRVEGYVKKLFVFSRGELVEKDAPILTIYSPDLLTTQNEFVDVLKMRDEAKAKGNQAVLQSTERLVESAKQRLNLWNISAEQIAELEKTRKPQETLTLYSPFKGVVQDIGVDQGRKVMNGDHLVDIADLSVVWVWAQFYQDELPMLKKGLPVTITTSSYPGEKLSGKISVIDPFINDAMRTGRVRIDVENADLKLAARYVCRCRVDDGHGRRRRRARARRAADRQAQHRFRGQGRGANSSRASSNSAANMATSTK